VSVSRRLTDLVDYLSPHFESQATRAFQNDILNFAPRTEFFDISPSNILGMAEGYQASDILLNDSQLTVRTKIAATPQSDVKFT
jgi:hypothetical protein